MSRVYNEPVKRPALSCLVSLIGRALQRSRVRIPYKPEFFSGFLFATAKIAYITAMIFLHIMLPIIGQWKKNELTHPVFSIDVRTML